MFVVCVAALVRRNQPRKLADGERDAIFHTFTVEQIWSGIRTHGTSKWYGFPLRGALKRSTVRLNMHHKQFRTKHWPEDLRRRSCRPAGTEVTATSTVTAAVRATTDFVGHTSTRPQPQQFVYT